jgi:putative membrane protein
MEVPVTKTVEAKSAIEPTEHHANAGAKASLFGRWRKAITSLIALDSASLEEKSSNQLAEIRTGLAVSRNLMAADRTLMAWIRTALAMNSFGFTIYKLLQAYQASGAELPQGDTPRNIGLFLTGMGTLAMVMGVVEYWQTLREMRHVKNVRLARPTLVMGIVMAVTGLFLFFAIITQLF